MITSRWMVDTILGSIDGTSLGTIEGDTGHRTRWPTMFGPFLGTINGAIEHGLGQLISRTNHGQTTDWPCGPKGASLMVPMVGHPYLWVMGSDLDEGRVPQGETQT
jgi:hypothetical protein